MTRSEGCSNSLNIGRAGGVPITDFVDTSPPVAKHHIRFDNARRFEKTAFAGGIR
jgi:hypothetical protein